MTIFYSDCGEKRKIFQKLIMGFYRVLLFMGQIITRKFSRKFTIYNFLENSKLIFF